MELLQSKIFEALGQLFIAGIVWFAWKTAYDTTLKSGFRKILLQGFFWCIGIAFFASTTLGNPTCIDSEQDNRGSTCYEYADDGFEPTDEQRFATFAYYMILLFVPVTMGVFRAKKDIDIKRLSS